MKCTLKIIFFIRSNADVDRIHLPLNTCCSRFFTLRSAGIAQVEYSGRFSVGTKQKGSLPGTYYTDFS